MHVDTCTASDISSLLLEDEDPFDSDVSICSTAPELDDDLIESYVASQSYDDYISAEMLELRGLVVRRKSQISSLETSMLCTSSTKSHLLFSHRIRTSFNTNLEQVRLNT